MSGLVNRAEVLLDSWKQLEQKLSGFGNANGSTEREMALQRYSFLRAGNWRLSLDTGPHEKANLELIVGSLTRLEKQLWPNPLVRLVARLKAEHIDRPKYIKEFKEMKGLNERELKSFLNEKGFSALVPKLSGELDFERPWFGMKMSGELDGGRRIQLELQVVKMFDGKYYPSLIDATLTEADGKKLGHGFLLSDYMVDAQMVANLMQGRAVAVMEKDGRGGHNDVWLQVQFERGESTLRNFNPDYGFDAGKLLGDFALQIGKVELDDDRLLAELKMGNQVSFIAGPPFNRTLSIEASPASKQLVVRTENGEAISMEELMSQKREHIKEMQKAIGTEQSLIAQRQKGNGQENGVAI